MFHDPSLGSSHQVTPKVSSSRPHRVKRKRAIVEFLPLVRLCACLAHSRILGRRRIQIFFVLARIRLSDPGMRRRRTCPLFL